MSETLSWHDWHEKKPELHSVPHAIPEYIPIANVRVWTCSDCHQLVAESHPCPRHGGAMITLVLPKGEVKVGTEASVSGVREVQPEQ